MDDKYLVDIEEVSKFLNLVNPRVTKNVTIETPFTLKREFLYHIALDKRLKLFPNISKRAGNSEDNTLPRVHVSTNLAGCIFGYASVGYMASEFKVSTSNKKVAQNGIGSAAYKGGYYIHEIPFRCALRPNKTLVYDADFTEEHWLFTYNEMTKSFPANIIGLLFPHSVAYYPRTGKGPIEVNTICLKIDKGKSIYLSLNNEHHKPSKESPEKIGEGYWMFEISDEYGIRNLKSIKEKEFNEYKLHSAGMLSYS